ncbi:copper transporter [Crassisporium funariophilum]|nr:copper transporter [Crassisporium funariophilum]
MAFESHLHWSFRNEHVLLPSVVLHSLWSFLLACLLVIFICLSERLLTHSLDKAWAPRPLKLSRTRLALWRTGQYSIATFLRLCYMLVAMTFHLGLILVVIASLSIAQFAIELQKLPKAPTLPQNRDDTSSEQPLLSHDRDYPLKSVKTRPRSKSKPDDIFIHPAESNIARADAVALTLGLAGDTERVQGGYRVRDESGWEAGKGKDMAREMLLGSKKTSPPRTHKPFNIGSDSDSDSSSPI